MEVAVEEAVEVEEAEVTNEDCPHMYHAAPAMHLYHWAPSYILAFRTNLFRRVFAYHNTIPSQAYC